MPVRLLRGWLRVGSSHQWRMALTRPDFLRDDLQHRLDLIAADKQAVRGVVVSVVVLADGETPTWGGWLTKQRPA